MGPYSMGRGAAFFRLRNVVYCPSLGARLDAVFMHGLSQIACMSRPSIEQGILAAVLGMSASDLGGRIPQLGAIGVPLGGAAED